MRVQVDQARHQRRHAEVLHFLFGIVGLQDIDGADVVDSAVAHQNGAALDRLGGDGKNVMCTQKHERRLSPELS